jgi:hypothetical protein
MGTAAPAERAGDPLGQSNAGTALAGVPLDLHEGICDARAKTGCLRWPEHFRLVNTATGELKLGRCRATNLCPYCQMLYVVETVEMLTLDALEYAPTLWVVLTAREHLTRADTYGHLRQLRRKLRRRWPAVEWFVQVEFQRRGALHLNLLVKGVPVAELAQLHDEAVALWCARVDAEPVGQWSGAIEDGGGVVFYLAKTLSHGLKREQAPPLGWRGHRTSQTRGYFVRPASVMREEARAALREKRAIRRAIELVESSGERVLDAALIEMVAADVLAGQAGATWELVRVLNTPAESRWADTGKVIR